MEKGQMLIKKIRSLCLPNYKIIVSFFCSIVTLLSFFVSNYPISNFSIYVLLLCLILCVFPIVLYSPKISKKVINDYLKRNLSFWFIFLFSIGVCLSFVFTKSFSSFFGILKILMYLWCAFLFTEAFSFSMFCKIFNYIFSAFCLFSLVLFIIILVRGENFSLNILDGDYYSYYGIFFMFISGKYGKQNCSLFWEPGIFSSICYIGLCLLKFNIKEKKEVNIFSFILYTFCIITSGSLAGILMLPFLIPLILSFFKKNKAINSIRICLSFALCISYLFSLLFLDKILVLIPQLANKGQSLTTRLLSFRVDFEIFLKNPIFGVGSSYSQHFFEIVRNKYPGLLDTSLNTFGIYLGFFGITGLLFFLSFLFGIFFISNVSFSEKIIYGFLFFIILCKEPHYLCLITLIIYFYILQKSSFLNRLVRFLNRGKSVHEKQI